MGESDLDTVHEAIPCALEDGEVVMVSWVVEDGVQCCGHRPPTLLEKQKWESKGRGSSEGRVAFAVLILSL